eukprot:774986-Amorphochlora_amoeboformis.AAC.1
MPNLPVQLTPLIALACLLAISGPPTRLSRHFLSKKRKIRVEGKVIFGRWSATSTPWSRLRGGGSSEETEVG